MPIENLEKLVGFGLSMGDAILSAREQPTALMKAAALLPLLEKAPVLFGIDYEQIDDEVKGLTPDQLDSLGIFIETNFPAVGADNKERVKDAISIVVDLAKVIEKAVAIWSK